MVNLKKLEKKLWKFNFQNGVFDITMGLILIITAIAQGFSAQRFYLYPLYFIPVVLSNLLNKKLILPRSGYVKFSEKRQKGVKTIIIIATIVIVIAMILTIQGILSPDNDNSLYFISGFIVGITALTAFYFELVRTIIYGAIITTGFLTSEFLVNYTHKIESGAIAWLATGVIITISGVVFLMNFIRKYEVYHD